MSNQNWHIFFDLDRTLWDFGKNSREALAELFDFFELEKLGINSFSAFFETYEKHNDACWDKYRRHEMSKYVLRTERFYLTLRDFGIIDKGLAREIGEKYVEISPQKNGLIPGALEVTRELAEHFSLHIITNGFQEVQLQKLHGGGLSPYFKHIITSELAGCRKPNAGIFKLAMQLSKAPSQYCIMIGDDWEADVLGAHKMEWQAIWFNERKRKLPEEQHLSGIYMTENLKDVPSILQKIIL